MLPMTQLALRFSLSDTPGSGVFCGADGLFVGGVPLLEQTHSGGGLEQWQSRPVSELNRDLGKRYGLPIEFNTKLGGLAAVARALERGDLIHARIATLHLRIPDPPAPGKSGCNAIEITGLARQLCASSMLKMPSDPTKWDPTKHPRWPAGSPDSIGGEFAPGGSAGSDSLSGQENPPVIPAQITIPAPFDIPVPGVIPFPSEILPPPTIPNISPRNAPRNPYPDRPECEEEWADAFEYCNKLMRNGRLGRGDYRGMGKTFFQCLMGQVSEDCGGNITSQNL
jgi:hypothetical protein